MKRNTADGFEIAISDADSISFISDTRLCRLREGTGFLKTGEKFVIVRVPGEMNEEAIERVLRREFEAGRYHTVKEGEPTDLITDIPLIVN